MNGNLSIRSENKNDVSFVCRANCLFATSKIYRIPFSALLHVHALLRAVEAKKKANINLNRSMLMFVNLFMLALFLLLSSMPDTWETRSTQRWLCMLDDIYWYIENEGNRFGIIADRNVDKYNAFSALFYGVMNFRKAEYNKLASCCQRSMAYF